MLLPIGNKNVNRGTLTFRTIYVCFIKNYIIPVKSRTFKCLQVIPLNFAKPFFNTLKNLQVYVMFRDSTFFELIA